MKNSALFFYFLFFISIFLAGCAGRNNAAQSITADATQAQGFASGQVVAGANGSVLQAAQNQNNSSQPSLLVYAAVNFGNGTVLARNVLVPNGSTAFLAFSQGFNVSSKSFAGLGEYVFAIEGVKENEGGNNKFWQYYVDGKIASVGVSSFALEKNGTVLEFRLESPEFG